MSGAGVRVMGGEAVDPPKGTISHWLFVLSYNYAIVQIYMQNSRQMNYLLMRSHVLGNALPPLEPASQPASSASPACPGSPAMADSPDIHYHLFHMRIISDLLLCIICVDMQCIMQHCINEHGNTIQHFEQSYKIV